MNQEYLLAAMPPDVRKGCAFPRTLVNSLRLRPPPTTSVGIAQKKYVGPVYGEAKAQAAHQAA